MQGANQMFRSDPRGFLESNMVVCYQNETPQKNDINRILGNTLAVTQTFAPTVDFDLRLHARGYYDLVMVGAAGAFRTSSISRRLGYGQPIVGNYIPYLGQKTRPNCSNFGKINLSRVTSNYIFTFTFTGCNFVVTQAGGEYWVYHEPTADEWKGSRSTWYNGEKVVLVFGPSYDDSHINGYGCLVRKDAATWNIYAQTSAFGQFRPASLASATISMA
jgi:hypothetical protein